MIEEYSEISIDTLRDICDSVRERKNTLFKKYSLKELPDLIEGFPVQVDKEEITQISVNVSEKDDSLNINPILHAKFDPTPEPYSIRYLSLAVLDLFNEKEKLSSNLTDDLGEVEIVLPKKDITPNNIRGLHFKFEGNTGFKPVTKEIIPFIQFVTDVEDIKLELEGFEDYFGANLYLADGQFIITEKGVDLGNAHRGNEEVTGYLFHPSKRMVLKDGLFKGWNLFKKVALPDYFNSIGRACFKDCENLEEVQLPNQLLVVPDECFKDCKKLEKVTIPGLVMSVGVSCFENTNLKEITFLSKVPPILAEDSFKNIKDCICRVPEDSLDDYLLNSDYNVFNNIVGV